MQHLSWSGPSDEQNKHEAGIASNAKKPWLSHRSKRCWGIIALSLIAIAIAVGVGVGVTFGRNSDDSDSDDDSDSPLPSNNNTNAVNGTFWRPSAGTTWQIVLPYPLNDTSPDVSVYDIDLFDNPASTIANLHAQNRKVICYFSAGSYESNRPDAGMFIPTEDIGKELSGWPGEFWLNTSSPNVRKLMSARITLAASKGCDGIDPDNVDGYDNNSGFPLTAETAVDFLTFLAVEAHSRGMAIGLKNSASIVKATLDMMQWQVNEECVAMNECARFRPFIDAGKPVFHVEYPEGVPRVAESRKNGICGNVDARGFSTLLKDSVLGAWFETC